jgi:Gly-Xaa carboxypeptidase
MEKGHVDVWFELHVTGGHSSAPFPHTGIGIISEIVSVLEAHPYEASLNKEHPFYSHMQCQARYSPDAEPKVTKLVEEDDIEGLTKYIASKFPLQFLVQTSQAVDYISGGQKINAMPELTKLGVNYRVAPHDSIPKIQHNVVKYIKDIVKKFDLRVVAFEGDEEYAAFAAENDAGALDLPVKVDYNGTLVLSIGQPSHVTPIAPTEGPVWDVFSGTIQHVFAYDGIVVPVGEIMTGNTDTRHYLSELFPYPKYGTQ